MGLKKETRKEFIIPFVGLNPGEHEYEFAIGNEFFEDLEYSEVQRGKVDVKMTLNKQSTMMIFSFDLEGTVEMPCDRCGYDFNQPISSHQQLIVKIGAEDFEDNDEIISIPPGEYEFDVSHYIYEYIILSLPSRRIHPDNEAGESGCDPEVIKKLDEIVSQDEVKENDEIDPRWAALKDLKKKKK